MRRHFLLVCLILATAASAFAQRFPVKVVGISDGDTFTVVNRDNLQLKIRIHGIDAPEKSQAYDNQSKKYLSSLIFGKNIEIDVQSQEKWGRFVAKVFTPNGKDVALLMLQGGMAWHYTEYDKTPAYENAQNAAKSAHKGLWGDKNPVAPWVFRRRNH